MEYYNGFKVTFSECDRHDPENSYWKASREGEVYSRRNKATLIRHIMTKQEKLNNINQLMG